MLLNQRSRVGRGPFCCYIDGLSREKGQEIKNEEDGRNHHAPVLKAADSISRICVTVVIVKSSIYDSVEVGEFSCLMIEGLVCPAASCS